MNCWKCGSSENLSIKARHRDGSIRIKICRDCRREDYHRQQESKIPVEVEKQLTDLFQQAINKAIQGVQNE